MCASNNLHVSGAFLELQAECKPSMSKLIRDNFSFEVKQHGGKTQSMSTGRHNILNKVVVGCDGSQ